MILSFTARTPRLGNRSRSERPCIGKRVGIRGFQRSDAENRGEGPKGRFNIFILPCRQNPSGQGWADGDGLSFLKAQGLSGSKVAQIEIDAKRGKVKYEENCEISRLARVDGGVSFDYLAKALPYPCDSISENGWGNIHSQRDAMNLVPFMEEFNQETLKVTGLRAGNYLLSIDGQPLRRYSASELSAGVNMAEIVESPQYRQASAIMYLNEERFEVEKRLREYVWMEFNVFKDPRKRFTDNWESIEAVNERAKDDWFVAASNYWYRKGYYPQIREVWKDYMEKIVSRIYSMNKPVIRKVSLTLLDK